MHPYAIRPMKPEEYPLLEDFLYEAIFVPPGEMPPARGIVEKPELRVYVEGFGTGPCDCCFVAEAGGRPVGAAWARIMDDYGHIDDSTPSIAIALYKEHRGKGQGARLLDALLARLRGMGCGRVSLAVQKANYARKLYEKAGFRRVDENEEEFIMVCSLA